ncbi:hypothetical protein SUGI_1198860 [Cryptomeria japonica]|uniref:uncharacterized protein LOC131038145 isoform X2 n=1 Tax=Cryptomeria japonica TaxID=3369 RepID=UPI002414CA7F|nr:uncharacterized protein LOC131038145 isoform X2 [Cryptomeria japonica]GLJ55835.1 hypothetical protein SUGI_1198860 [Cryptomeria japonica]
MTTNMSNGGEDLLLTWSSKVEELVDEDKTEEAINLLNDVIAKLEILDDAHTNLTLSAACNDIGRLYTKGGFSDKADSFFTKAFLIKQEAQQQQSVNFRNEISVTSRTPANEEIENSKGITISEASSSTSLEEDWEAIADQSLMQSSSSQVTVEVSKLSLENQSLAPKQHGRGAFTYGQRSLYSDETNEITKKESMMDQPLDGDANQLHTRVDLKYGTSHVVVVCGFSPKIPTRELEHLFEAYTNHGVVIRRVNDTVALAVFRNPASAREALKSIHSQYNIRALDDDDSLLSSLSAKDLEPPFPRPKTSARTAQRIIMGALQSQGLVQKSHIKSSYSDIKKQEEERRNRILMRQKLRDEAWGPDD